MDECFVVAVFIHRIELQMPVEIELKPLGISGQHDPLIHRAFRMNDGVTQNVFLGQHCQRIGFDERDGEDTDHQTGSTAQACQAALHKQWTQQVCPPQSHCGVDQTAK